MAGALPQRLLLILATYKRSDSLSVKDLMDSRIHGDLTCNNSLMLPGKIDLPAFDVITETKIARNVILRTPFMSSPMDTITETDIAISPALLDGIRVVHPSPPSLEPDALYPPETGSLGAKTCRYSHFARRAI